MNDAEGHEDPEAPTVFSEHLSICGDNLADPSWDFTYFSREPTPTEGLHVFSGVMMFKESSTANEPAESWITFVGEWCEVSKNNLEDLMWPYRTNNQYSIQSNCKNPSVTRVNHPNNLTTQQR